jgi:hypothetical protein
MHIYSEWVTPSDMVTQAQGVASTRSRRHPLVILERIALGVTTMILSINVWTGFPLLALWVGSRFAHGDALSMLAIVIALVTLVLLMTAATAVLSRLSARYDRVTGKPPVTRQHPPWLRSMSGGKIEPALKRRETNAVEAIVVLAVVAAFVAFEVWFFFLAGSSLSA